MNIDFDKITTIKKLGAGVYGTTYLVKYNNMFYALKIQHILPSDKNKSYKKEVWRELDLYYYINKLKPYESLFFTKLYDYKIYDNCKHEQIRNIKLHPQDELSIRLLELDKSNYCVKFLTEFKGEQTLTKFLQKNH